MKFLLLPYFCLLTVVLAAQEVPVTTQQQLENLGDENLEDDALLQQLEFFRKNPINLNVATAEDLQELRFLTALQIANFIRYRSLFGKLIDIHELQAVPGFDVLTIQRIRPYVVVGAALSVKDDFISRSKGGEQYILFRYGRVMEKAKGYDTSLNTFYLGDANRLQLRYRYQFKNLLYYGLLGEKDAGEPFFKRPQKFGFDFYSVHFFLRNLGNIKALAIGDYTVNLGQGLTQWQSLGFGKSVDVMNIKRQSPVLSPYRSAAEFYFNRGVGITLGWKDWEFTGFGSYKKFSGNLDIDSILRFTSFGTSGYHRTKNEIADRYALTDLSYGGNISYKRSSFKIAANAVAHQFSKPLQKRDEPYNYYALTSTRSFNASVDYSYTYKNAHLFGEFAVDQNNYKALVQGLVMSLDKRTDFSLLYRNISKGYQSLFGNAFTESTLPGNEKGLYAGILLRPTVRWQLAAYADFYQFDFIKYRMSAPAKGWDYQAQVTYLPDKKTEIYLRYRSETKPLDVSGNTQVMALPEDRVKKNLRLHFVSQVSSTLTIKGRTEMVWYGRNEAEKEEGFLSFLELAAPLAPKLKGNFRLQYFETGSYDSRIYAYESDVLYSFSIPPFSGKGYRFYVNINVAPLKNLTCWLRIAQTYYPEQNTIGSGLEEIRSSRKTEVKAQLKLDF